jgi:hypothetical protein
MNNYYIVFNEEENTTYLCKENWLNVLTKCLGKKTKEEMIEQWENELKNLLK